MVSVPTSFRLSMVVNGRAIEADVAADRRLIDVLRLDLGLTGTKESCGIGVCGACSVLVDGALMSACLLPAPSVQGRAITTVEGLAGEADALGDVQRAFLEHGGLQCGFCTPGQLVAATALLAEEPDPSESEVVDWMSGNLCRCTGYRGIVASVLEAARIRRGRDGALAGPPPSIPGVVTVFSFAAVERLDEAFALLAQHGDEARLLAGGTALTVLIHQRLIPSAFLIGLAGVPGLDGIHGDEDGGVTIGAMTSLHRVERDPVVRQRAPGLADGVHRVASVRVRNQATLGGNLVHADPAQDPPPVLLAHDASVILEGPAGRREVLLDQFHVDLFETAIRVDEVLTAIRIPPQPDGARFSYRKFLPRTVDDFATVSVAARIQSAPDGTVQDVRIALGSAASVPMRAVAAEAAIRGRRPTAALLGEAAALARDASGPLPDVRGSVAYKREMVRVWTERSLLDLTGLEAAGG